MSRPANDGASSGASEADRSDDPFADDPFALLGLPRTFALDAARLRAAHLRLLSEAHPDRADGAVAMAEAARRSAALTEAYRALSAPLTRAEALLRLEGAGKGREAPSPEFLMEALENREALDAAIAEGDATRVGALRAECAARRAALLRDLEAHFALALAAPPPARAGLLEGAQRDLAALRYVERMLARAADA